MQTCGPSFKLFFHMQVFNLDLSTERNTAITLRGLKMENRIVVDSIDKLDPSNMSVVQLKALEKEVDNVVYYLNDSNLSLIDTQGQGLKNNIICTLPCLQTCKFKIPNFEV